MIPSETYCNAYAKNLECTLPYSKKNSTRHVFLIINFTVVKLHFLERVTA